jgi:hypothetical protein
MISPPSRSCASRWASWRRSIFSSPARSGFSRNWQRERQPLTKLAGRCGVPFRTMRISADAMLSLGLLERDGERYRNTPVAAAFLAGNPGPDLRPMLRFWDRISYPAWTRLENAVRSGKGQPYFDRFSEEEQRIFSTGVEAFTAGAASALANTYDFGRHHRLLDVAGGTSRSSAAIPLCAVPCSHCRAPARWRGSAWPASPKALA